MKNTLRRWFGIPLSRLLLCAPVLCTPATGSDESPAPSAGFQGWQAMRVISLESAPNRLLAVDLERQGRDSLVVVNTRQSRLDLYRWMPAAERETPPAARRDRPNELPLAPEWEKTELPLDELPLDVVAGDLDSDGQPELVVLTGPSNKVVAYRREAADKWTRFQSWDMLSGSPVGQSPLLLRPLAEGKLELLLSLDQGIQTLRLEAGARPTWLSPREVRPRLAWKLVDLDGDGDQDLVEWSSQARQTIRWYACQEGKLLPAQALFDQAIQGLEALSLPGRAAELLLLGGAQQGLLRRYALAHAAAQELGRQESLPIGGGAGALWQGMTLDGRPAMVAVDASQPQLRVFFLSPQGWLAEEDFPSVGGIKAVAAPQGEAGTLLLWTKDAADLSRSRWDAGRLTYPAPWPQSPDVADRRILALATVGATCWWAQRVGSDIDLYQWPNGQPQPMQTRFTGLGAKVDNVVWLGGNLLLAHDANSNGGRLARIEGEKLVVTAPAHLAKIDLTDFQLLMRDGALRPARLNGGVLQWLDDNLQPVDQVMLSEGQRLASFVSLEVGQAWALEQGGEFIHRLQADDSGILRQAENVRILGGVKLVNDPVLGMILVDSDRIIRLSRGEPWELKLIDSLDARAGRPEAPKDATIHRLTATAVNEDEGAEVLLFDDAEHHVTVMGRSDTGLAPLLSWQVFEDGSYPYGGEQNAQVSEPRVVVGLNADGDPHRDLALLCHDRLLIYIAREAP